MFCDLISNNTIGSTTGLGFTLNYGRFITGGTDINIDPKLLEIYIRVPLLIKLYKKIFAIDFEDKKFNMNNKKLHSDFRLTNYFELYKICYKDNISTYNISTIIEHCNSLYEEYKNEKDVCYAIMNRIADDFCAKLVFIKSQKIFNVSNFSLPDNSSLQMPGDNINRPSLSSAFNHKNLIFRDFN